MPETDRPLQHALYQTEGIWQLQGPRATGPWVPVAGHAAGPGPGAVADGRVPKGGGTADIGSFTGSLTAPSGSVSLLIRLLSESASAAPSGLYR